MADYMAELAALTGLRLCPNQGPFGQKEGAVIGERDGYILAIGPGKSVKNSETSAINFVVRFPATGDSVPFNEESMKRALETAGASAKGKEFDFTTDAAFCSWTYAFTKHKAEEAKAFADAFFEAVKAGTQSFGGKCEVCRSTSTSEIMLLNGLPGFYCSGCQQTMQHEMDQAGRAYESMEANFMRGLIFSLGVALACSVAWGLVAYFLNRIFLWGAIGIGFAVGWAFVKGAGKVENMGKAVVALLTLASVLFGDAIFFTLSIMKQEEMPFSWELLQLVLANFWELETESGGGWISMLFAIGGALYSLYAFRKPTFEARFEPLGMPKS